MTQTYLTPTTGTTFIVPTDVTSLQIETWGGGYFGGGQGRSVININATSGGGGGGSSYFFSGGTGATLIGGNGAAAGDNTISDHVSGVGFGSAGTSAGTLAAAEGNGEVFLGYTVTSAASAPEPGSLALLALAGMPAICGIARWRRKTA